MKLQTGRYSLLLVALALLGGGGLALRSLPQPNVSQVSPSLVPGLSPPEKPFRLVQSDAQVSEQVYRLVSPAVVTVYAGPEVGSGSFVRSGWVITNRHVVRETSQVTVKTADQTVYEGEVKAIDIRNDLALIHLTTPTQFPTVRLAESLTLQPGDRVFAIGSPFGKAGTLTRGTFSRMTERGSLQTSSGLLKPGNSGGPLLNDRGEMIGVNKGLLENDSGLATSVLAVRKFLDREFLAQESLEKEFGAKRNSNPSLSPAIAGHLQSSRIETAGSPPPTHLLTIVRQLTSPLVIRPTGECVKLCNFH